MLIVVGLSFSAPPSCVCAPDDHFGMLLHPLFPHVHGQPGALSLPHLDQDTAADDAALTVVVQAPGISSQLSETGARDAVAGLLLPLMLAGLLLSVRRARTPLLLAPTSRAVSPPRPPPRALLLPG